MRRADKKEPVAPAKQKNWAVSVETTNGEWELWSYNSFGAQTAVLNHHGDLIVYGRYNFDLECYTQTIVAYAAGSWTKFVTYDDISNASQEKRGGIDETSALHNVGAEDG